LEFFNNLTSEQKSEIRRKQKLAYRKWKKSNLEHRVQPTETLEQKNKKGTCPDQVLDVIKKLAEKLGRTPSLKDLIVYTGGQRYKHLVFKLFGSWKNAIHMLGLEEVSRNQNRGRSIKRYTEDELLEYLAVFYHETNKIPTATDCKRGLLPDYNSYLRIFGSFPSARRLAGIPEYVHKWDRQYGNKH